MSALLNRPMSIDGVPVIYDENTVHLARAVGMWPKKRIVVGPAWWKLTEDEQLAVLYHELGHCRGFHFEKRAGLLCLVIAPILIVFPWPMTVAVVVSLLAWEFVTWIARGHELEADRFSAARGYGAAMSTYLRRPESRRPDSEFYPSHADRLAALAELTKEKSC